MILILILIINIGHRKYLRRARGKRKLKKKCPDGRGQAIRHGCATLPGARHSVAVYSRVSDGSLNPEGLNEEL